MSCFYRLVFIFLLVSITQLGSAQTIYFEDFNGLDSVPQSIVDLPGVPMTALNMDGLMPDSSVSQFVDAWMVLADIDNSNDTVAASTSKYSPSGTADDWMVTPQLSIPDQGAMLSWRAKAQDSLLADGYEVWVSTTTNDTVGFFTGMMIFSVAQEAELWTSHSVDLAAFSNQLIYIAFRNHSTDQYILLVDDIRVEENPLPHDVALNAAAMSEYAAIALLPLRGCPIDLKANVGNNGLAVNNLIVTCNVYKNGEFQKAFNSDIVLNLPADTDTNVVFSDTIYLVSTGIFIFEFVVSMDEEDGNSSNDTVSITWIINNEFISREYGQFNGALGIGAPGILGQNFNIKNKSTLNGVVAQMHEPPVGEAASFSIFSTDSLGRPDTLIAQTDTALISAANVGASLSLNFEPVLQLIPGTYFIGINESGGPPISMSYSNNIFTPGVTWVKFGSTPWSNLEQFGYPIAWLLRPLFEPCPETAILSSTIPGYEGDIKYEVNSLIISDDLIKAGASDILYDAGSEIYLIPGFSVELGADFEAVIDGCGGLRHRLKREPMFENFIAPSNNTIYKTESLINRIKNSAYITPFTKY